MLDPLLSPFLFTSGAPSIQQHQWPCTVPSLRKIGSLPTRRLRFDFSHSAALLGSLMRAAALQSAGEMKYRSARAFHFYIAKRHCSVQFGAHVQPDALMLNSP